MFTQANKDIARYVDRGDYFRDSVQWYCKKFISPIPHWAYIFVIIIFMLYGTYIITTLFLSDLQVKKYPLPIYSVDQVKYFPHIKPLSEKKEPINVSISRYLTSSYVKAREEYNFANIGTEKGEFNKNFINSISSARTSYEYESYISNENPDSPIVRYKTFTIRNISIDDVVLVGRWDLPEKALIYYTADEISKDGSTNREKWISEITFSMNDLEKKKTEKESRAQLRFTVTSYKSKKLS